MFQFFFLVMAFQGFEDRLELSIHYFLKLMDGQSDTMVGHSILRKVVGANLFAAVAGANRGFAFFREGILLLLHFHFVKASAQNAHPFLTILDL